MNTDAVNRKVVHMAMDPSGKVWCGVVNHPYTTLDPHRVTCRDCRRRGQGVWA